MLLEKKKESSQYLDSNPGPPTYEREALEIGEI
jgi:hypothetical protein